MALLLVSGFMFAAPSYAQEPAEDAETLREQNKALMQEQNPIPVNPVSFGPLGSIPPLFGGVDDASLATNGYLTTPPTVPWQPLFGGLQAWGAAYNTDDGFLYVTPGSSLYRVDPATGTPTLAGNITGGGSSMTVVSLAYCGGTMYTTRNISSGPNPEGLYTIDPATAVATLLAAFTPAADYDIGGLACDTATGILYGTNDASALRGLVSIEPATAALTLVAAYPAGETDIDGLAVGNGIAYLIEDDSSTGTTPGQVHVYDLGANTYLAPFLVPWTTSETFSSGAWIEPAGATPTPTATVAASATATSTPIPPTVTSTPIPPSATATVVTSIELGGLNSSPSNPVGGWALALLGLTLGMVGVALRRRR